MVFCKSLIFNEICGGERGIRTHGTSSETTVIKAFLNKNGHETDKTDKKRQIKHYSKDGYYTKINPSFYTHTVGKSSVAAYPSFALAFA